MSEDSDVEGNDAEPDGRTVTDPSKRALSNEEKLSVFLDNPDKSIKVFLSSYSWAKGYVWYVV